MYFVYILLSVQNHKTYTGSTDKLPGTRLCEHNAGSNDWTRENGPFKLLYYESYCCKADALHREQFFKSGVGNRLVKLIKDNW